MNFRTSLMLILVFAFAGSAFASPCAKQISQANGEDVKVKEEEVFISIFNARKESEGKREYWLRKSQVTALLTFTTSYSDDHGGSIDLHVLDLKTCKEVAVLLINSWD